MPTYEYLCKKCNKSFSLVMTIAEHDKRRPACPHCKSRSVRGQISGTTVITSKKS